MPAHTSPKVAVVLSGCGFLDGSEIHESVAVLMHLARLGAHAHCFAPDQDAPTTVNHFSGEVEPRRQRNMLHESARIARGGAHISALASLDPADFDAVIFPGGFGAAKNLSTFAIDGADCDVLPDVERALKTFHAVGKPIGVCCIAPTLVARVFGKRPEFAGHAPRITLGPESPAADAVRSLGATHVAKPVTEALVDEENRIVSTPAYMCATDAHGVYVGVGKLVEATLRLAASPAPAHSR